MKSYLQGLITGAVLMLSFILLTGAWDYKKYPVGKWQIAGYDSKKVMLLDTQTGILYDRVFEQQEYWNKLPSIKPPVSWDIEKKH